MKARNQTMKSNELNCDTQFKPNLIQNLTTTCKLRFKEPVYEMDINVKASSGS